MFAQSNRKMIAIAKQDSSVSDVKFDRKKEFGAYHIVFHRNLRLTRKSCF